uniref:Uncharacterized mitochondrial protein AtMg00810-like n=1 Tax=Tanacetum cinerariifolium TaxID=118510 RepID=A0A6L2K3I2_TANCI|nr:uncharacterized mitochondrial protein AtMg00810-like [Tanacetum cinerariifolium]
MTSMLSEESLNGGANVNSSTDLLSTGSLLEMSTLNVELSLDGTLNDVRTALDDRLNGIWMKYLPQTIWRRSVKKRVAAMIQAIDKQLKTRRIMRSLEKFVGGRLTFKDGGKGTCFQLSQRFITACSYPTINKDIMKAQIHPKFPKKVYKVVKALYGLHQAPRAWYATLSTFLVQSGYRRGLIDKTLFIKKDKNDIMLVQVYVDDIIFGSIKKSWCDEFEALMKSRFQISFKGELTFFLGLQVKQKEDGIFISRDKYVAEILKKFDFMSVKTASILIETKKPLVKDAEVVDVDVHLYRSMIGSLMYLTASRPDIMYAVCACSRFQVTSKTSHLQAMK